MKEAIAFFGKNISSVSKMTDTLLSFPMKSFCGKITGDSQGVLQKQQKSCIAETAKSRWYIERMYGKITLIYRYFRRKTCQN